MTPRATYRLQLRGGIGFAEAAAIVPYLAALGISHLYASPIFAARTGSTHGYDAVDPNVLDPSLGGEAGFARLVETLRAHGMGLLLGIVPNHLGGGQENPAWQTLLRWGRDADTLAFFDIDWQARAGGTPGKLLLPVLGRPYEEALARGELTLRSDSAEPDIHLAYFDRRFPLDPRTWPALLAGGLPDHLLDALARVTPATFDALAPDLRAHWPETIVAADLDAVLARQCWRLAWWRDGNRELNWRRFFDITDLVAVKVEDPAVFEATHRRVLGMVAAGEVDGLRVDHVDGLADPAAYLARLDRRCREVAGGRPPWLLVEKILGPGETLPAAWPVAGTTGYEALNDLCGLFVDPAGRPALDRAWRAVGGDPGGFAAEARAAKRLILEGSLAAETGRLAARLGDLAPEHRGQLRCALVELACALPVYRIYGAGAPLAGEDRGRMERAVAEARDRLPEVDRRVFDLFRRVMIDGLPPDEDGRAIRIGWEQLTGPAMAKSLEDTAFYRWYRLIALNEVGGDPERFGIGPDAAHRAFAARGPAALVATATHDTKRGEDTRLRIAALSAFADLWAEEVAAWRRLNARRRGGVGGPVPEPDTEYLIYQTLVGVYPLDRPAGFRDALATRLSTYLEKALREAKRRTDWLDPDRAYEAAVMDFVRSILNAPAFVARLEAFVDRIAPTAAVHGLAQTALKLSLPGVPDIYQGTELWDFSLVDPDNRRPVDFAARAGACAGTSLADLVRGWRDGRVKQRLIADILAHRARTLGLWGSGTYRPLAAAGPASPHVFAFAREAPDGAALIVVPRLVDKLLGGEGLALEGWADTTLPLPRSLAKRTFRDIFSGAAFSCDALPLARLLPVLPVAVLTDR